MDYEAIKRNPKVCVLGLGYVGLPLAVAFGRVVNTVGFDLNKKKVDSITIGKDPARELTEEEIKSSEATYTSDPGTLRKANFIIVCVPTPIDDDKKPDLTLLEEATKLIGQHLQKNTIITFESTVYPGVTEDICVPLLERESKLKLGGGFGVGYSPERINPGDREHSLERVVKVVSGHDEVCRDTVAEIYGRIVKAGVYKAASIKVAEAVKVVENIQRDVNIAMVNELSYIFQRDGINTYDVLKAAKTKWNFVDVAPGLVGGHCIGVDPYYLAHKATLVGHTPRMIMTAREINEGMGPFVAERLFRELKKNGHDKKVLIVGLSYKDNVSDTRNSKVLDIIQYLRGKGCTLVTHDPLIEKEIAREEFDVDHKELHELDGKFDAIVIVNKHKEIESAKTAILRTLKEGGIVLDLKNLFPEGVSNGKRLVF